MLERTRHTIRKNATVCLAGLAFTAVAIPTTAWASTLITYAGCGTCTMGAGGFGQTVDGYLNRDYNRVYRPTGNDFRLAYFFSGGGETAFDDSTHNPFVQNPSTAPAIAKCINEAGIAVTPVTCQTTEP